MLDAPLGGYALRSGNLGNDPSVSKVVSTATSLLRDLQAMVAANDQLSRVATAAAKTANKVFDKADEAIDELGGQLKELVCSFSYTYDGNLSPESEISRVQDYALSNSEHEKDPLKLLRAVTHPLTIPSVPGSVFYMACGDDLETHNPPLYGLLQGLKQANPDASDTALLAGLMPTYALPSRGALPPDLLDRWNDLITLSATNDWEAADGPVQTTVGADEVLAIAGLQTMADYRLYVALKKLDDELSRVSYMEARQLVTIYQELGLSPNHQATWLARGKIALSHEDTVMDSLVKFFTDRREDIDYDPLWTWLSEEALVLVPAPASVIAPGSDLKAISDRSVAFTGPSSGLSRLMTAFGVSGTAAQRKAGIAARFVAWKTQFKSVGGILGFEGVALLAALTALERCRAAARLQKPDDEIAQYADEGLKLAGYMSNAKPLLQAFAALKEG